MVNLRNSCHVLAVRVNVLVYSCLCIVLYCVVLYCTVLYCIVLCCIVLCCVVLVMLYCFSTCVRIALELMKHFLMMIFTSDCLIFALYSAKLYLLVDFGSSSPE